MRWIDGDSAFFNIKVYKLSGTNQSKIILPFEPPASFIGIAAATMQFAKSTNTTGVFKITGLSTNGLEGENEPPLSTVADALDYRLNIGWKGLANHARPELMGEELFPLAVFS